MNYAAEPRPGWLLIGVSWLLFLDAAVWFSFAFAACIASNESVFGIAMMLTSLLFVLFQFLGAFRNQLWAALTLSIVLVFLGCLWLFISIVLFSMVLLSKTTLGEFEWFLVCTVNAIVSILTAYFNLKWINEFETNRAITSPPRLLRFSLSELLGLMFLVSIVAGLTRTSFKTPFPSRTHRLIAA